MSTTVGIKLETDLRERLQKLGEKKDRSTHWMMKKAISEYLEREEFFEKEKREDMERWAKYQENGEALSNDDMALFLNGLVHQSGPEKE